MLKIGESIREYRKARGLTQTQLADRLCLSKQAISNYENGRREPDYVTLEAISRILDTPISAFISHEDQVSALTWMYSDSRYSPDSHIPVLGSIPAGVPLEEVPDIIDWEEIPEDWTRNGRRYFALQVHGLSMYPRYEEGDVIILRMQDTCESGQDCAVRIGNDEATFKRVKVSNDGIILQAINPDYDSYVFTNKQVIDLPVKILGVVVELRRKI